jgi:hypothetical protein
MCASLAPERLYGFYSYSAFKSLSILDRCLVNVNILASRIVVHHRDLPENIEIYSKKVQIVLIQFQNTVETVTLNKIAQMIFSGK